MSRKKARVLLSVLLSVALLCSLLILPAAADTADWSTQADTSWFDKNQSEFTLTTPAQLAGLAELASTTRTAQQLRNKTFKLGADIVLNDVSTPNWIGSAAKWTPIFKGNSGKAIVFDGQNHTITGLYLDMSGTEDRAGLFGTIASGATVKNVTLASSYIVGSIYCGGIAGENNGTIENCTVDRSSQIIGADYGNPLSGAYYIGGIAGNNIGTITNCTNYAAVSARSAAQQRPGNGIGGIAGMCHEAQKTISGCVNYGEISAPDYSQVGGIVGRINPKITLENCSNEAPVTGGARTGGIAGAISAGSTVSGCTNAGNVSGTEDVGGIVGYTDTLAQQDENGSSTVQNCVNLGPVSGEANAGGVVGTHNSNTTTDTNQAAHAIVKDCYSFGGVSAPVGAGVLVGRNDTRSSDGPGAIEGCLWAASPGAKAVGVGTDNTANCISVNELGALSAPLNGKNTLLDLVSADLLDVPTYKVTYTTDHGAAPAPITQVVGFSVELPDVAQHVVDKYTFSGWKSGEDMYRPGSLFNAAADATVTAVWAPPSGAPETQITGMPNPVVLPHGDITLSAPEKPTYSYKWQFSTDAGGTWADVGANSTYVIRGTDITINSNGWLYRCEIGNQEPGREPVYKLSDTVALNVQKGAQAAPDSKLVYGGTERINGITSAMEYQAKGAAVWTACPDGSMTGLSAGAYLVRYAETEFLSASAPIEVTVSAYTGGGGGGGGTTPTPPPTVETNPDGSTTKTETAKDGTVTETTEHKDGTVQVVETKPDGTVTESVKTPDGLEAKAVTSPEGKVEAEVTIPAAKAEAGTVALPISELPVTRDADKAPVVTVKSDKPVTVAVPVAEAAPGMVAVIVNADGTEEIVTKSVLVDGALVVPLEAGATVKLVDKSVDFADAAQAAWAGDAIAFVSSHELFQGTGEGSFSPNQPMNRAMLVTVLHRLESKPQAGVAAQFADVDSGAYYTDAVAWASESGIVTGTGAGFDPDAPISREQLATILYRYMAKQGVQAEQGSLSAFTDGGAVSPWAQEAMGYAVGAGLMTGKDGGALDPQGTATRAEVAVVLQRLVEAMAQ
ncbi:hypothetical protein CE91St41_21760 [Oscillospiraceae bacterium]|nr:hypothetical protein CE91St40_15780 [Oscillospiraceae bacterium]BDF75287.1 hypothetical protein CE91St41_21760 [Oscillospiraceae bacterium]